MEVNGIPIVETPVGDSRATATLAENFDNFLILLTTQLQNQDPLSPLDSTEFTNQLTNFAQVEQIIASNRKLDALIGIQGATQLTTGVSYIGRVVEALGNNLLLENGSARLGYELSQESARTSITILDEFGNPVRFLDGNRSAGGHILDWDGTGESGNQLQDGIYTVLVAAFDGDDQIIETTTTTFAKVTGVEINGGETTLVMGPFSVDLNDVISVHAAEEPAEESTTT